MKAPTTRILAETGRLSIAPIFVLGVYSGTIKLGEGYGSSLQMAEYRACEDALRRIYLSSEEKFEDIFTGSSSSSSIEGAIEEGKNANKTVGSVDNLITEGQTRDIGALKGVPSDTLTNPGMELDNVKPLLDDETQFHSKSARRLKPVNIPWSTMKKE